MRTEIIRDMNGKTIRTSRNLAGVRRYIGERSTPAVKILDISRTGNDEGKLSILWDDGSSYETNFASYTVLRQFVRSRRNAYGAPLSVNGEPSGHVHYRHPKLIDA